jgi:RHS repeat-associated protein
VIPSPRGYVTVPDGAKRKVEFTYDHQARRIQKTVSLWTNSAWSLVLSNRFLYDGWNLIAELNATDNAVIRSYMWGLDLSGTEQGAGGVGGMLAMKPAGDAAHFAAYDGNGNVTALVDGSSGTISAAYEYGPFGETLRLTGAQATANKCRFSTKYADDDSDFLYYGHRYYNPSLGRWLSRDPIGEKGGPNVSAFVKNDSINWTDALGFVRGKCGTFTVTDHTPRFEVDFAPDPNGCSCKKESLRLVQAAKAANPGTGKLYNHDWRFDIPYPFNPKPTDLIVTGRMKITHLGSKLAG